MLVLIISAACPRQIAGRVRLILVGTSDLTCYISDSDQRYMRGLQAGEGVQMGSAEDGVSLCTGNRGGGV